MCSVSWVPMVSIGCSAVDGSWATIAICRPRMARKRLSGMPISSTPSSRIEPVTFAPCGSSPNSDIAVIVLPLPLSPAMPSTSPAATVNDMSSTAL
jgi:hypothetical protein